MKTEPRQLEVGDVIYKDSHFFGLQQYVIDQTTERFATAGTFKFRRAVLKGGGVLTMTEVPGYLLETKELKKRFLKKTLSDKILDYDIPDQRISTLYQLLGILEYENPKGSL
jgi:hypothetical protein